MRHALIALLLGTTAACTISSNVPTTSTFTRAQQVTTAAAAPKKVVPRAPIRPVDTYVSPTAASMRGGTWVIEDFNQDKIYRLPLQTQRVTTILLREGEKLNGISAGDEGFSLTNSYVGRRAAVNIMPGWPGLQSNLHLTTTNSIYSIYAYTQRNQINLVDFRPADDEAGGSGSDATGVAEAAPTPQGDYSELSFTAPDGKPLPAWAPVKVWADSMKLVVRFAGPLPVLPALFAGQQGEQMVSYRVVDDGGNPTMITDRRVTEAQLRLDLEVIDISAQAPEAESNPHGWREAGALPPPGPKMTVFMVTGTNDSQVFQASTAGSGL